LGERERCDGGRDDMVELGLKSHLDLPSFHLSQPSHLPSLPSFISFLGDFFADIGFDVDEDDLPAISGERD